MPSRWQESGHLHTFWHRTAMTFLIIVAIVAVLAGALASMAGFGIGSLLTPLLGAAVGYLSVQPPAAKGIPTPLLVGVAVACGVSLVVGVVSLWGIRSNGAPAILLVAGLGDLLCLAVGALALVYLVLSGLPGP
jgi:hypothetical protein